MATADTHSTARLEDVAALANVSLATASKALHGKPRVSEDTRERVMEAARQLNYSPNKLAQSLASGRSGTIGLVTSDLQGRFSTPILIGAENELRAQSTSVLLANARGDDALERSHVEKLLSLKVDGLLIVQCETNPRPSLGRDWGVPLRADATVSPLLAAMKRIRPPPTAPRARWKRWPRLVWNRLARFAMAVGTRIGGVPPPDCCSTKA